MKNINLGNFPFCYQSGNQDPGLFVQARIYDVTSTITLLGSVVLQESANGLYSGIFNAVSGKSYLVIIVCYTDGTFTTIDLGHSPWAECYKTIDSPQGTMLINYGAFDQMSGMFVAMNIYRFISGAPVLINRTAMYEVFAGVYFGKFTALPFESYVINTSCYTDGFYTTIDLNRPSGSDCIEMLVPTIFYSGNAILTGQNLSAVLEATC